MNILLVNWQDLHNPHAGGAEIHLFEIFSRLAARGHRVRLVCAGFAGAAPEATIDGVVVRRHGGRHTFALRARAAIRRELAREDADVVVDDINKLPLCTPSLTNRPVYALVPHLFGTTAFREVSWPLATMVWVAERVIPRVYRQATFHAISESTRDDLVDRGVDASRIAVVHPGVDSERFTPAAITERDPAHFVYLGRLKRYKGVEYLIDAVAVARARGRTVTVDIAGAGDDRPRLEGHAASRGVADRVRFRGFVDDATKLSLLRRAVANVFPSPKEGWGITVMEAAACGTPSIASDSPGLRDSVRAGETGVLVPHGNADALADAMLHFVDTPDQVASMGRAARHHAERLSWDAAADQVERHLQDLVAGRAPAAAFSI